MLHTNRNDLRGGGTAVLYLAAAVMALALAATPAWAGSRKAGTARPSASATTTQFIMLDMVPGGGYTVRKNSVDVATPTATPWGTLPFVQDVTSGDKIEVFLTNGNPGAPPAPSSFGVTGSDVGCVDASWQTPAASDYVDSYVLLWGTTSGSYTDSTVIDGGAVADNNGVSSYHMCGFADGTYYFALRAHSLFNLWSSLSAEASAQVTNGSTQGPSPPTNVSASEDTPGCAKVTWTPSGDLSVTGYMVYFGSKSVAGGQASAYDDSLDAGNASSAHPCGFAKGTYYFAVRSYDAQGTRSVYSQERGLAMVGIDNVAPAVSNLSPADGATGVPLNSAVAFTAADAGTGVDSDAVAVTVDGQTVSDVRFTGSPAQYNVVAHPGALPADSLIQVSVTVADLANPANTTVKTWSFRTGGQGTVDSTPPAFSAFEPADGATGVAADAAVSLVISDDIAGVDVSSIVFEVDGQPRSFDLSGTPQSLTLRYANARGFAPGATISVHVSACDLASPANCATGVDYSFTVASQIAGVSEGNGAIVPNGYWADDPTRPLEVRHLPPSWTVRIFDTAGHNVRTYTNQGGSDVDWTWDFENNSGRLVARSLYLVRVTGPNGEVKQSGRFLVQRDP